MRVDNRSPHLSIAEADDPISGAQLVELAQEVLSGLLEAPGELSAEGRAAIGATRPGSGLEPCEGPGGVQGLSRRLAESGQGEELLSMLLQRLLAELSQGMAQAGGAQPAGGAGQARPQGGGHRAGGRGHRGGGRSGGVPGTARAGGAVGPRSPGAPAPGAKAPAASTPGATPPAASAPPTATAPGATPPAATAPGATAPDATPPSPTTPGATPHSSTTPGAAFEPNPQAIEAARRSPLGAELQRGAEKNAAIYRDAAEKTGVPASMVAAIHFNEGHMTAGVGPESGYGLDPRYVSTAKGNAILAKYGMGAWDRGTGSEQCKRQSAVIAADMLKSSGKAAGVDVKPGMTDHDAAVAIHAYGTGTGSKSTKRAQETGRGFMFDPSDPQPHPKHPGGTSIGKDGEVIRVPPGYKNGLLRWDVAIPLLDEKLGGPTLTQAPSSAPAPGASAPNPPAPSTSDPAPSVPAPSTSDPAPSVPAPSASDPAPSLPAPTDAAHLQGIPPRPADALTGAQVRDKLAALPPGAERERFIQEQIERGNIPDSARQLHPVTVSRKGKDGQNHEMTMYVMPDYLAIGSDQDNVRVPMTPGTAQKLADKMNATLPTTQMVDDIHAAADKKLHLDPIQWKPGAAHGRYMLSGDAAIEHDRRIDRQLGDDPSGVASGHKKDIVIPAKDGRVAIYGARASNGERIQPYSNIHEDSYADYSHGARMVGRTVLVDGKPMDIRDVMADPTLAPLVSNRGPIKASSY